MSMSIIDHKKLIIFLSIVLIPSSFPRYSIFSSGFVRLILLATLSYAIFADAKEAILAFVIAVIMMIILRGFRMEDFMLGPDTDALNSCQNVKYADILALFGGDEEKLKAVLYWDAGCPQDILLNDNYAPVIMTYLTNFDCKYKVGDCGLPPKNDILSPQGFNNFGLDQL